MVRQIVFAGNLHNKKIKRILKDKNNYAFSCRIRIICNHDTGYVMIIIRSPLSSSN